MSSLKDIAPEVEVALMELAEALGLHQDDIPNADYVLTKLAMACYTKGTRRGQRTLTDPMFRAPRSDETPRVLVLPKPGDPDF